MGRFHKDHSEPPSKSYMGEGDIEAPVRVRPSDGIDPVHERDRMIPLPWESWASINEKAAKASADKKDWLAEQFAKGLMRTPGQIKKAALYLGCTQTEISRQKLTKGMADRVSEKLRTLAVYATAEALPYQADLAKTEVASFDRIAKIAKVLESSGVTLQQNTMNIDQRNGGDNEGDRQFFKNFQERAQRRLAIVPSEVVDDAEDPGTP